MTLPLWINIYFPFLAALFAFFSEKYLSTFPVNANAAPPFSVFVFIAPILKALAVLIALNIFIFAAARKSFIFVNNFKRIYSFPA